MEKKKAELRIQYPFSPDRVGLNDDTTLIKIIACVAMFCDHAGKMLFPQYRIFRIIGRIAFPMFAYCAAVSCVYTHDPIRYLKRLVWLALVTQPIYAVALAHTSQAMYTYSFADNPVLAAVSFYVYSWAAQPSILLTLIAGSVLCRCIRDRHISLLIGAALIVWYCRGVFDYGWKGIALIVLFYLFIEKTWLSLPCVLAFMLWWGITNGSSYHLFGVHFGMETFAVFGLPIIYIHTKSNLRARWKWGKWAFYVFYPGHMVLIYILNQYVLK